MFLCKYHMCACVRVRVRVRVCTESHRHTNDGMPSDRVAESAGKKEAPTQCETK
jgi:hypothetical protein